ncbi:MAG: chorismate-binding protein, partial [Brevundimonas sp.]|nr:chorismate-binding protein [Brevundimonas sp.]
MAESPASPAVRLRSRPATEALIVEAGERILLRDGFPGLNVQTLAAEAGCDRKLVYRYFDGADGVVARIAAGELFQANIARAWTGELNPGADPFDVMLRLADRAAAYGAFWRLGDRAIVSNSPELFLTFDPADRRIETRPIKGTRPRHPDPAADAVLAGELQASAKDRAENLMIVDLMRNDLSRVAEPGSVAVGRL